MCYFKGKAVGQYCSCCQRCSAYLEACVPVVADNGFAVAECDLDFCCYCPMYAECKVLWGTGGVSYETAEL